MCPTLPNAAALENRFRLCFSQPRNNDHRDKMAHRRMDSLELKAIKLPGWAGLLYGVPRQSISQLQHPMKHRWSRRYSGQAKPIRARLAVSPGPILGLETVKDFDDLVKSAFRNPPCDRFRSHFSSSPAALRFPTMLEANPCGFHPRPAGLRTYVCCLCQLVMRGISPRSSAWKR